MARANMTINKSGSAALYQQIPSEGVEQSCLFRWADLHSRKYPELKLLFHIPNGGKRSKAEAGRFKAEGVKAGVPDLFLPVSNGREHGLFIELKKLKGGIASAAQKEWLENMRKQGYRAEVCHGWQEAAAVITDYLKLDIETW